MDQNSFERFCKIIHDKSGIAIGPGKESLISSRIAKRIRQLNLHSEQAYLKHLIHDQTGEEIRHFLDVISTNVTNFFRQPDHLEFLTQAFLCWRAKGQSRFRYWSCACSTGQEPYSLGMKLLESYNGHAIDLKILATDISQRVLRESQLGLFDEDDLKNVPRQLRMRYFQQQNIESKQYYAVKPVLKNIISFRRLNLAAPPFPMNGPFDAILCCNVLIYFNKETQQRLVSNIAKLLKPGGYLLTGYSESVIDLVENFKMVKPSIMEKL